MRVLSYSPYDDTGGSGYHMATAFNALRPEWAYHSVVGAPSYLQYPRHTPWVWDDIAYYWREADVVHLHDGFHRIETLLPQKPAVVTFHGTGYREHPGHFLQKVSRYRKATALVSTLDLQVIAPDRTTWCPVPMDLDFLAAIKPARFSNPLEDNAPLRVCHAPTARSLKATAALELAVDRLQREGAPIELVIVEGKPWRECLTIKATCDVYFDQLAYGYGANSVEAWAMGMPVISGAVNDDVLVEMQDRFFGRLPFLWADSTETIYRALLELLTSDETCKTYARIGREYVERFHSQRAGVELLAPIYERTAAL